MILFDNWTISNPDGLIGYQYDHKTRALMVSGNLPEGWSWDMLMDCGGQLDIIHLEPIDGGVATVLTAEQLSQDGYYTMQLRGAQGVAERHTNKIAVYIPGSLDGSAQWPEIPSEFTQLERRCRLLSEQAEQAAVRAETAAAGVQDISQQVQQVEASKRAAEQAAQDARDTAAGIHDVSDQVAQVEASKQAAQAAQSAAEQAAADTGADRQAVETAAGQVSADKGSIDQMVRQAGSLATQIRQDTQTNGQLAAQIAQDAQQAKADAASVAAAMPKLEAAVPAADRAETAQQAAETAKTNAEAAAQRAEAAAGSTTVDPTLANAGQAADAKAAGDAIRQLSTQKADAPFVVRVNHNLSDGAYTADHTSQEAYAAFTAGKTVVAKFDNGEMESLIPGENEYQFTRRAFGRDYAAGITQISTGFLRGNQMEVKKDNIKPLATNVEATVPAGLPPETAKSVQAILDALAARPAGGGGEKPWKEIGRFQPEINVHDAQFTTYADGSPLDCTEIEVFGQAKVSVKGKMLTLNVNGTQRLASPAAISGPDDELNPDKLVVMHIIDDGLTLEGFSTATLSRAQQVNRNGNFITHSIYSSITTITELSVEPNSSAADCMPGTDLVIRGR